MTRVPLLAVGVVCCVFGVVSDQTDGPASGIAYGVNSVLAVLLMVLTYQDLRRRGWTWQAWAVAASFLLPLVGLVLYAAASTRPEAAPAARAEELSPSS